MQQLYVNFQSIFQCKYGKGNKPKISLRGNTMIHISVRRNITATLHQNPNAGKQDSRPSSPVSHSVPTGSHWNIAAKINAMLIAMMKTIVIMMSLLRSWNMRR